MITNILPCTGLNEAVESQSEELYQLDNIWVSTNDVKVQAIIDSFDSLSWIKGSAIKEIAQHANDLIDSQLDPLKVKRLQADALSASIKKGNGAIPPAEQAKLDSYESAMVYPAKIFAQYDIEEAAIIAQTDWTLINIEAAKANLDAII